MVENEKKFFLHFFSKQSFLQIIYYLIYLIQLFDLKIGVKESLGGTTRGELCKSQRLHCEVLYKKHVPSGIFSWKRGNRMFQLSLLLKTIHENES